MRNPNHAHPCNLRLVRALDRGWGEMAFEYCWESTSGRKGEDGQSNPDLNACTLYEYTTYSHSREEGSFVLPAAMQNVSGVVINQGRYDDGWYYPPDPPFAAWKFRDPTDGRTAPVALGCFSAVNGWAWDRHKAAGRLHVPEHASKREENTGFEQQVFEPIFVIAATQEYRFHCSVCGMDAVVPGSHSGPHDILRSFGPRQLNAGKQASLTALPPANDTSDRNSNRNSSQSETAASPVIWRYSFHKHQANAYYDMDAGGYVDDSAHIGFGP